MIKEKNIAVSIILYFVTCGIYYLVFMADSTRDVDIITNNPEKRSGGTVVLLSLFGLSFVNMILLQSDLNKYAAKN